VTVMSRKFLRNDSGAVAIAAPAFAMIMSGIMAFAIDSGNLYYCKLKLQKIADAAAEGAVLFLPNTSTVSSTALNIVSQNSPSSFGSPSKAADVELGTWNPTTNIFTVSSSNINAVKVTTHRSAAYGNPVATFFGTILNRASVDMTGTSIATLYGGSCVIVLDAIASGAFSGTGSGGFNSSCGLQVNSTSSTAASIGGSAKVVTSAACVTGGFSGGNWNPTPLTGSTACPQVSDPLSSVAEPSSPGSCTTPTNSVSVLTPGCYTGSMNLNNSLSLSPGLYYFKNATVKCNSTFSLTGSGVQIFVDKNSTLDLTGGSDINLSASSAYNGILIFVSRSATGNAVSLGGNGALNLNGTLYMPSTQLTLGGNSSLTGKSGYVIVDKISFGGSSTFTFDAFGTSAVHSGSLIKHAAIVQ
jgi:Flp pilus assembly protein TadG